MEFCGVFYETGYLRAVYDRIRKLFFVFLMAAVLTVGMMGQGMETINFGSVRLKDMAGRAVAEYAAGVGTTGSFMISVTEIQISADVSADPFHCACGYIGALGRFEYGKQRGSCFTG